MRGLASSTCWLFIIAILPVFSSVSEPIRCDELDKNGDILQQMKECTGEPFELKPRSADSTFNLSKLDQATADKILYDHNGQPKKFVGHVTIIGSALEKLILSTSGNIRVKQKINIAGNRKLNNLKLIIPPAVKVSLTLKGNKQLSMRSIRDINKIGNIERGSSTIQEFQDCSFDGKLKTLDDLKECSAVEGDLIIDQDTTIPSTMPFIQIEKIKKGCLRIENSKLTSIDFLEELLDGNSKDKCADGGQSHIKGNKQLCIPSEDWPKWNGVTSLVYAGTCRDRCSLGFALANKDAATAPCDIVVGDVKITGDHRRRRQSDTPPQLAHWDRVKELEGTLEISNTNLEKIVIFNNLERITNPSPDKTALTVIRNPKMIKFNLTKLANITMPSGAWSEPMFVEGNGNFSFSYDEGERWKRITGRSYPSIPIDSAPLTIGPSTLLGVTTKSPKEIAAENKRNKEKNEEKKRNETYIVSGVSAGIVVLVIIAVVAIICLHEKCCNIKGRLGKEDHDFNSAKVAQVVKKLEGKRKVKASKKGNSCDGKKEELTKIIDAPFQQLVLNKEDQLIVKADLDSIDLRVEVARAQMSLDAKEIPFKMTDVIMKMDAPELDFQRAHNLLTQAPLPKMKYHGKPYRHVERYKVVCFNPKGLNRAPVPYMEKYDRLTMFKYLITHCSEVFVTNAHLLPDIIADCSGPYYTPSNTPLVEIEGPVYVIGDIHEALHVLQTILNLDLDGEGKKHKIHPMFRHKYLFLGDYLDKGEHGLEVYFLLCLAARLYPSLFTVLRGNHDGLPPPYPKNDSEEGNENLLNYYGDLLGKKNERIANPDHFAEIIVNRIYEKVTPFLPMAAIINGQTFTAHGGFTLTMVTNKKSIREIFKEVSIPYYDEIYHKTHQYTRHFHSDGDPNKEFTVTQPDQYTTSYGEMLENLKTWKQEQNEYIEKKKANPNMAPDYNYESRFPGLHTVLWSDPAHSLASAGNQRNVGCAFSAELFYKMMENNKATEKTKPIVDIIRAHQVVGLSHSCHRRVTTVFTNCDHVLNLTSKLADLKCPTDITKCTSILRINEDGSRTAIFLAMTTDKPPGQALANPKRKFRRMTSGVPDNLDDEKKEKENKESESKPQEDKGAKPSDSKDSQAQKEQNSKESKAPKEKSKSNSSDNKPKGTEKSTPSKSTTNEKQPKEAKETTGQQEKKNSKGPNEKEKSKGPKASKSSGSKSADEEKKGKEKDKNKK